VCQSGFEFYRSLAKEGGHVEGGLWKIVFLRYVTPRPRDEPLIDIVIRYDDERVFHPGKAEPEINRGVQTNYSWFLTHVKGSGWKLADWQKVD
jgi:hypothetical protein